MGQEHAVRTIVEASYTYHNIKNIINRGLRMGFIFYDRLPGQIYEAARIMSVDNVVKRFIGHDFDTEDYGPLVYVDTGRESFFLWFHETDHGYIRISMGSFGSPQEKNGSFDFAHYIRLVLDLSDDFITLSLETDVF